MAGHRRTHVLALLTAGGARELTTARVCQVCSEVTEMDGAGIMLMSDALPAGSVCTSHDVSAVIEQLQYDLGEGPCVDAFRQDRPVAEPDLADPEVARWPAFSGPALAAGARAVFGFPLQVGAVRLGAMNLFRLRPGRLTDEQHANGLVMADVAAQAVLVLQAHAAPGQLAAELEVGADFQYSVHQAAGMVAVQLDVSVAQALIRLRAHAFGNDRALTEVAADVIARRLRFDAASGEKDPVA